MPSNHINEWEMMQDNNTDEAERYRKAKKGFEGCSVQYLCEADMCDICYDARQTED